MTKKAGRPEVIIDWDLVEKLAKYHLAGTSIAARLGIHPDILAKHVKKRHKMDLTAFLQQKRAEGCDLLRESQYKSAIIEGNTAMQIWLGKQYLSQADKQEITHEIDSIEISIIQKTNEV
jgi:hypothetical protein